MRRTLPPSVDRKCVRCGEDISPLKRADASYCSRACVAAAEKARYCARNPDYVARQQRQSAEIKHMKEHGHTRFLDNPLGNPKDRFRVARSLGFRSMLEYQIAKQLEDAGIPAVYEGMSIEYVRPVRWEDGPNAD